VNRNRKPPKVPRTAPTNPEPERACDARDDNGWRCYNHGKTHRFMAAPLPSFPPMGPPDRPNRDQLNRERIIGEVMDRVSKKIADDAMRGKTV
jgi:hypothetical protein